MPWQRTRCVRIVVLATLCIIAVTGIMWNIRSRFRDRAAVSGTTVVRRVRAVTNASDTDLYRNQPGLSVLFPSRTFDTHKCTQDLTDCQLTASCRNSTGPTTNCPCRQGFYFRDSGCHACTACDRTQYVAAECSTHRNTICVDVSFPVGILPMNQSHLLDDGTEISTTHSSNVFLERLIKIDALETAMYVTNNQQSLDFAWPRTSGLDIAVSISDVYLVPDYHDLEAVDDTSLFHKLSDPSQRSRFYYNHVQTHYCRHPLPDYYSIQMEVIANRTSTAQIVRCDSQDESVTRCPSHYKDGDRFLKWNINSPCRSFMTTKLAPLKDGPNSVVCTEETDMLRQLFHRSRPTTQEYMFPSRECEQYRQKCEQCLRSSTCPSNTTHHNDPLPVEGQCCGIHCYWQIFCRKTFSPDCPPPSVECATGEVNIFSLFPHFDSLDYQFACHLRYVPPQKLYSISYTINIPSVNFNTTSQHFTVASNSRGDHEKRLSHFDFITALHDTRIKVAEELILIGNHNELKHYHTRLMQPYTIRDLKTASDLKKEKASSKGNTSRAAYVQFEKPFLFSSRSWYKDGCRKNVSQIYPNQTIYKEDFTPVIARKSLIELEPDKALFSSQKFTYQLYHRDRAPYVKFYVEKGRSVLQHLQGAAVRGRLVAGSLHAAATWHQDISKWKLIFSASQDECPSIISVKIFTKLMTRCVGHFDLLINCPLNFTVTFELPSETKDLPNIFVLQVNDSSATHNIVLTLIYPPSIINDNNSQRAGELQSKQSLTNINSVFNIWISIVITVMITVIFLVINCISLSYIHKNVKKVAFVVPKNSERMTLKQQEIDVHATSTSGLAISQNKIIVFIFVILYTIYSFMFTFSLGFGIIYLTQSSVWSDIANPKNLSKELLVLVDKSLHEITKFEEQERARLYASFKDRTKSCLQHLKSENRKHLLNYQSITKQNIDVVFTKNGTLHYFTNEIQKRNFSIYLQHILQFVTECNKTLTSIVDRFQANYYLFIRNTVHNDWLKIPRQIFLYQDGEDPERKFLSSTQVKQFATWLEVDKAEELFAVMENVFGRLSSVAAPQVSVLDLQFPSLQPHLEPAGLPDVHAVNDSYMYTVLDPLFYSTNHFPNDTLTIDQPDVTIRSRRNSEKLELGSGSHQSPENTLSSHDSEEHGAYEIESQLSNRESNIQTGAIYKTNPHVHSEIDAKQADNYHKFHESLADVPKETSNSEMKIYHPLQVDDFTSPSVPHSHTTDDNQLYILVAVFLTFDFVLLVYRATWLRRQLQAVCNGFPERIPVDETCKQLVAIQTDCQYSKPEEVSRYYLTGNAVAYQPEKEMDVTFFKHLSVAESNDNAFQRAWNEKMNKTEPHRKKEKRKCFFLQQCGYLWRDWRRVFQSHFVWQGSVTFLVIVCVCVLIYCVEFCLTPHNFQSLLGGQSAVADVQWHLDTSNQYLKSLAMQLTAQLQRLKHLCDHEVAVLTDVYFTTINMQTSVFADVLQKLCQQVKGKNCDKLLANHLTGERIVGCNFLPLHAQAFPGLSFSQMDAIVLGKLTPLKNLSHHLLLTTASVIVFFVCCRLVCQTTAATVKLYLLQTGRLPQVLIYQSEKVYITSAGGNSTMMQRSQSWVDSCESGVYLGETEDTNKEDAS